jgi:transposase
MVDRDRFVVDDETWAKVAALLPGKASDRGVTARDNRLFLEAVLWRVRTGLPWRDLPCDFGNWNSVFQRFRRWAVAGVFDRIFERLSGKPDFEYALIDGTIVSAHQKCERRKRGNKNQAIGGSRGGLTTKIVARVDGLGNLVRFVLPPGQRHETNGVPPLIGVTFGALLGNRAFDVDWLRAELDRRGACAVIPSKSNRKLRIDHDKQMYRWRHLVENYFAKLKEFRAIATRYNKTDTSNCAANSIAAAIIACG